MENMERRIPALKRLTPAPKDLSLKNTPQKTLRKRAPFFFVAGVLIFLYGFFSGTFCTHAQNAASYELLRFPLWYPIDDLPSLQKTGGKGKKAYEPAIAELKALAPFMTEGLVYGWRFSYTPSDKLRAVPEFFEVQPIVRIDAHDERLSYTDAVFVPESNRLECWVEYRLSEAMRIRRLRWQSAAYPKIAGRGEAPISHGGDGIKEACRIALKNAVRSYAQSLLKNKPKEISGTVLLTDLPRYYIKSGKYCADLDFFLFVSKIDEYTQF